MKKISFLLVFIAGLVFAYVLPILKTLTVNIKDFDLSLSSSSILATFPSHSNIDLLDVGYLSLKRIHEIDGDTALTTKESTEVEQKNDLSEAESCLRVGARLLLDGRLGKAKRLLERAVALAPSMPQALLALGEFLEVHQLDVVRADLLYVRALMLAPKNKQAIKNRIRTKDVVVMQDLTKLKQIDQKRLLLSNVPDSDPALKRIQREAYYHHIHHTVAIEGNTMTLDQIRVILDTGLSIGGKSVAEHTEVLGVDSALRYINNTLVHRVGAITLQDILAIHLRVLGHTDPPAAGHLRTTQVFVGPHLPPSPTRLQQLMEQFVAWINEAATVAMHPVRCAALAHYHLVYIHPFVDGNGRTARLLMNFLLMQAGYPPIIIRHQDRLQYYDTLQAANEGDTRPFVRFISHCTEKTLDVYLWATQDVTPGIEQEDPTRRDAKALPFARDGKTGAVHDSNRIHARSKPAIPLCAECKDETAEEEEEDYALLSRSTISSDNSNTIESHHKDSFTVQNRRRKRVEVYDYDYIDDDDHLDMESNDIKDEEETNSGNSKSENTVKTVCEGCKSDPISQDTYGKSKRWSYDNYVTRDTNEQFWNGATEGEGKENLPGEYFDDLGLLFDREKHQQRGGAAAAHHWLHGGGSGGSSDDYKRSSRYYSRLYHSPNYRTQDNLDHEQYQQHLPLDERINTNPRGL
uniref:Protein adenylyltransferase Fic n=2 Tax=Hirondellea gigas TaxID=1518452 RepID=A0A6A7G0A8_9CRUS